METGKSQYQVIVSNIGTVYSGTNGFEANHVFASYAGQSKHGVGRAANEEVTLMKDGEIKNQYGGAK